MFWVLEADGIRFLGPMGKATGAIRVTNRPRGPIGSGISQF